MVSDSNTYIIFYTCFWTRALPSISQNLLRAVKRGNIFNFYIRSLNFRNFRLEWILTNKMIIMNSSQKFSNTNLSWISQIPKFNIHPSFISNSVLIVSHTYNSIRQMIQLVETHESSSPSLSNPARIKFSLPGTRSKLTKRQIPTNRQRPNRHSDPSIIQIRRFDTQLPRPTPNYAK